MACRGHRVLHSGGLEGGTVNSGSHLVFKNANIYPINAGNYSSIYEGATIEYLVIALQASLRHP